MSGIGGTVRDVGADTTLFSFQNLIMAEECPICLENLSGTVVHMGCCNKRVHIQCYIPKCPMCRADLPIPTHCIQSQHVIVPIGVRYEPPQPMIARRIISTIIFACLMTSGLVAALYIRYP
jgi:hypothetical protein